ncbi:MAG: bleomycin resistance family protein [Rhizobiales bacterium 65-9]|nr:VOC family protein [Hyphomicrobiales bacterium]OJY37429.1 MAG: bleomycin resistance family protein [Rhizobiales bacterium 65-9]
MRTFEDAKAMAKALREQLAARQVAISHSESLELVARQFGLDDWNVLAAKIAAATDGPPEASPEPFRFDEAIPIFRIFALDKAREFYCDWLGFSVDWEHRFGENFPLYMQVSRAGLKLHLSEHHGDATPGSTCFVEMRGVAAFHREIRAKDYRHNKPGLDEVDWGWQVQVTDPFNNRIRFCERKVK